MLLDIFRHVDTNHRLIVVEKKSSQSFGQFGLAYAGWSQEQERTDWTIRVLQTSPCAAHRIGDRHNRFVLAYNTFSQRILHRQQFLSLALQHLVDRNTSPSRDHGGDIVFAHLFIQYAMCRCGHKFRQTAFEVGDYAIGQFASVFEVSFALRPLQSTARLVKLFFQSLRIMQLVLFCLPSTGKFLRAGFELAQLFFKRGKPVLRTDIRFLF